MHALTIVLIYILEAALFILIPFLFFLLIRKKEKSLGLVFFLSTLAVEIGLFAYIYFNPIISYSNAITSSIVIQNKWGEDQLKELYGGFYSKEIPIIPYRYHVVKLDKTEIDADVYYLPIGKISVSIVKIGDKFQSSITRPLSRN